VLSSADHTGDLNVNVENLKNTPKNCEEQQKQYNGSDRDSNLGPLNH
jgi:hypothetical protein